MVNSPADWFKNGKMQQFEGQHDEAVQSFKMCLNSNYRVEVVVKELYNSLIKLKRYQEALDYLLAYEGHILQRSWFQRELLNTHKKLDHTDLVISMYLDLIRDSSKSLMPEKNKALDQDINELSLFCYKGKHHGPFTKLLEQMASDSDIKPFRALVRIKWMMHVIKDVRQALRPALKNVSGELMPNISLEAFMAQLSGYSDYDELRGLVAQVFPLVFKDFENDFKQGLYTEEWQGLVQRFLMIPCPAWSLDYLIQLCTYVPLTREIKSELQAYAQYLIKHQEMSLLNLFVTGIPNLYDEVENHFTQVGGPSSDDWYTQGSTDVNEKYGNTQQVSNPGYPKLFVQTPVWSRSELQYIEKFIDYLSQGIEPCMRYAKQFVVASIANKSMSPQETAEVLWGLRLHYEPKLEGPETDPKKERLNIWLRHVVDLLLKDLYNPMLWIELSYVVERGMITSGQRTYHRVLVNAANNAALYGLYIVEKKQEVFFEPKRNHFEDPFVPVDLVALYKYYSLWVEHCRTEGYEVPYWDSVYGLLKSFYVQIEVFEENPCDSDLCLERVKLCSQWLYELSQDLYALEENVESKRYFRFFFDRFSNLKSKIMQQNLSIYKEVAGLFDDALSLYKGDRAKTCVKLLQNQSFNDDMTHLAACLANLCVGQYYDFVDEFHVVLAETQKKIDLVDDYALTHIMSLLTQGIRGDSSSADLSKASLVLLNHALVQLVKGRPLSSERLEHTKVQMLEQVELDQGIVLFKALCHIDPTSLSLQFHLIDFTICTLDFDQALAMIDKWFSDYQKQVALLNDGINAYEQELAQLLQYQKCWIHVEAPLSIDMNTHYFLGVNKGIYEVKQLLNADEFAFLRNILIHKDLELLTEVIKGRVHEAILCSHVVIDLLIQIFQREYRVLVLLLQAETPHLSHVAAFERHIDQFYRQKANHYQYYVEHGPVFEQPISRWVEFKQGHIRLLDYLWVQDLISAVKFQQPMYFQWLCALGGLLFGTEAAAYLVKGLLDDLQLPKWDQNSYWQYAYERLPHGYLSAQMGVGAIHKGRFIEARKCFEHIEWSEYKRLLHSVWKNYSLEEKDDKREVYFWAYLARILSGTSMADLFEAMVVVLDDKERNQFLVAFTNWFVQGQSSKVLKDTYKQLIMQASSQVAYILGSKEKNKERIVDHIEAHVLFWYAQEQRSIGNKRLAYQIQHIARH